MFQPWIVERPFWPGLDRPPGQDAAERAMDVATESLFVLLVADTVLYLALIGIGMCVLGGYRCAWAALAWGMCKATTAVCRALLSLQILDEQLRAIPDPLAPQYTSQTVEVYAVVGLICILLIRLGVTACFALLPQFLPARTGEP